MPTIIIIIMHLAQVMAHKNSHSCQHFSGEEIVETDDYLLHFYFPVEDGAILSH